MAQEASALEDAKERSIGGIRQGGRLYRRFLIEFRRFLGMFLYLWAMFGLLLLHESVVLARYDIAFTRYGFALVTALVLAKVMLVLENLRIARSFEGRPLIYPILFKSAVFACVFLAFYVGEETVGGLIRGKTALASLPSIGGGTPQGVLIALLIVSLALVPYFAFTEIGRALGKDELHALLFTRDRRPANGDA